MLKTLRPLIKLAALAAFAISFSSCATSKRKNDTAHQQGSFSHETEDEDFTRGGPEILSGRFVVTATNGTTVVYRQLDVGQARSKVRIVVDYAPGLQLPEKGTVIERQSDRGFEVVDVTKADDGNRNFFARDLTAPSAP